MNDGSKDIPQLLRKDSRMSVSTTIRINRRRRKDSFLNSERALIRALSHRQHRDFILEDESEDKVGLGKNLAVFSGQAQLEVRR